MRISKYAQKGGKHLYTFVKNIEGTSINVLDIGIDPGKATRLAFIYD